MKNNPRAAIGFAAGGTALWLVVAGLWLGLGAAFSAPAGGAGQEPRAAVGVAAAPGWDAGGGARVNWAEGLAYRSRPDWEGAGEGAARPAFGWGFAEGMEGPAAAGDLGGGLACREGAGGRTVGEPQINCGLVLVLASLALLHRCRA